MTGATTTTKLFAGALAALGTRSLIGGFTSTIEALDLIGKRADRLGISGQRLRELSHAAELSGSNFRALSIGMQRATRRIAEAAKSGGKVADTIEQLGLSVERLNGMSADKQLLAIADAMTTLGSQNEKIKAMFTLFDSEGVGLVNMFERGADGVNKMSAELREFGGVMSEQDFDRIAAMNDELLRMRQLISAQAQEITITVGPAVLEVLKGAQWLASGLGRAGSVAGNYAGTVLSSGPRDILENVRAASAVTEDRRRRFPEGMGGRQSVSPKSSPASMPRRQAAAPLPNYLQPALTKTEQKKVAKSQYEQATELKKSREVLERILHTAKGDRFSLD
jgi:hypothetical protein